MQIDQWQQQKAMALNWHISIPFWQPKQKIHHTATKIFLKQTPTSYILNILQFIMINSAKMKFCYKKLWRDLRDCLESSRSFVHSIVSQ